MINFASSMKPLDPEIFEAAAKRIETLGWASLGFGVTDPEQLKAQRPPAGVPEGRTCAMNALGRSLKWGPEMLAYQARLRKFLKVNTNHDVFLLNDTQPDYQTGKKWAIDTLRAVAAAVRKEQR